MTDRESYIRQETVTGVVPMLKGDRQYSFLDLFLSTSGFAIATWCYTQGAYVAQYLSFSRMLINIFCFNIVWVFIECLSVIFATRYGIDLWIWLRSVLDADMTPLQAFMISAEGNVAFAFSWSTQALVLPRLAKTERGGYWGTTLAYGVVAPFFVAAGGVMALAMFVRTGVYESDPTNMLSYLCGSGFALLSLLLVAFANVGTQGTGSYVNCMIVKSGMPKVSYKVLVLIAMVYVSALTVWGGVEEHFGAFISIAAFIQAPIIGMIVVDYLVVKKRKLSLKAAYFIEGHDAYRFTGGFNLVGIGCVILSCLITILFVYNPLTGSIQSPLFLIFTGSGFDAICGGLLYWLASLTPLKKYMLRDRDDLEIV